MGVRAVFAVLLLFVATVKAGKGGVQFWRKEFTMTCPGGGSWFDKDKALEEVNGTDVIATVVYKNKGFYRCEYKTDTTDKIKYYFYVQGKTCDNCYELEATMFLSVIVADILMTICVMFIICKCAKKKGPAGLTHTSKSPARSGGRGPPVPSPDYEQLNLHTRSQDTYSMVNRTG
ncbi:T-cell surface glycoprotein CD3 epsilon chain-like [Pagrus major]|uniref:T-cell surface glycoprotein CD3 epsilon chain-like n=1 Tax=Pagrus major TaxID=143350 RepID=UPI003CC89D33